MKVWVVIEEYEGGEDIVSVFASEDDAYKHAACVIADYWNCHKAISLFEAGDYKVALRAWHAWCMDENTYDDWIAVIESKVQ